MIKNFMQYNRKLKQFLDTQYSLFNAQIYLHSHPDPLQIAHKHRDFIYFDELCLICALYAYGNVQMIVKNLSYMPFSCLIDADSIKDMPLDLFPYYRFQTREDTKNCFLIIADFIKKGGIKSLFLESYTKHFDILHAINRIEKLANDYINAHKIQSYGLQFLFGNPCNMQSTRKRYNMFLRWLIRKDNLDFGLWHEVDTSHLLLPLDTHTFKISKQLGLCKTKSYNLKAVKEITHTLKSFDSKDPIKYDFALYRIGQLGLDIVF